LPILAQAAELPLSCLATPCSDWTPPLNAA
jgi:hypothetical protein